MKQIYLITGNEGKLREFNQILGFDIDNKKIDLDEIQSLDPKVIGEHKVRQAYKVMRSPVLVEDTTLDFAALEGLPGPFVKWFLDAIGPIGLIKLLVPYSNRKAIAKCTITYYDGKTLRFFEGIVKGRIASKPLGKNGFGWDFVFIPDGSKLTFAQMTGKQKNEISHRRLAIEKLKRFLSKTI
jgi:non-canonical purine NTP pyrophosphatase (RdgB/HAM1 family)